MKTRYGRVDYRDWEEETRASHVCIKDILILEPGTSVKYICMDRNVWDIALDDNKEGTHYDPLHFFRANIVTFTKTGYGIGGTLDYPDVGLLEDFELHLEYRPGNWFPLQDGQLPAEDDQGFADFPWTEPQSWRNFPLTTRVGYRGPFVRIDKPLPRIMY